MEENILCGNDIYIISALFYTDTDKKDADILTDARIQFKETG